MKKNTYKQQQDNNTRYSDLNQLELRSLECSSVQEASPTNQSYEMSWLEKLVNNIDRNDEHDRNLPSVAAFTKKEHNYGADRAYRNVNVSDNEVRRRNSVSYTTNTNKYDEYRNRAIEMAAKEQSNAIKMQRTSYEPSHYQQLNDSSSSIGRIKKCHNKPEKQMMKQSEQSLASKYNKYQNMYNEYNQNRLSLDSNSHNSHNEGAKSQASSYSSVVTFSNGLNCSREKYRTDKIGNGNAGHVRKDYDGAHTSQHEDHEKISMHSTHIKYEPVAERYQPKYSGTSTPNTGSLANSAIRAKKYDYDYLGVPTEENYDRKVRSKSTTGYNLAEKEKGRKEIEQQIKMDEMAKRLNKVLSNINQKSKKLTNIGDIQEKQEIRGGGKEVERQRRQIRRGDYGKINANAMNERVERIEKAGTTQIPKEQRWSSKYEREESGRQEREQSQQAEKEREQIRMEVSKMKRERERDCSGFKERESITKRYETEIGMQRKLTNQKQRYGQSKKDYYNQVKQFKIEDEERKKNRISYKYLMPGSNQYQPHNPEGERRRAYQESTHHHKYEDMKKSLGANKHVPKQIILEESSSEIASEISPRSDFLNKQFKVIFEQLDSKKIGELNKSNCAVEKIHEQIKYLFGGVLSKIRYKNEKYTLKQFSSQCQKISCDFDLGELKEIFSKNFHQHHHNFPNMPFKFNEVESLRDRANQDGGYESKRSSDCSEVVKKYQFTNENEDFAENFSRTNQNQDHARESAGMKKEKNKFQNQVHWIAAEEMEEEFEDNEKFEDNEENEENKKRNRKGNTEIKSDYFSMSMKLPESVFKGDLEKENVKCHSASLDSASAPRRDFEKLCENLNNKLNKYLTSINSSSLPKTETPLTVKDNLPSAKSSSSSMAMPRINLEFNELHKHWNLRRT